MEHLLDLLGGEATFVRWVSVGLLVAARVLPLATIAPWLALRSTPTLLRTAVALAITVALTPLAEPFAPTLPAGFGLAALALREAIVGGVFGVAASLPLFALDWSGQLVDTWRGATMAEILAPPTGERSSALGTLQLMLGVAIFVTLGGHRIALVAFGDALRTVPVGRIAAAPGAFGLALGAARLVADALAFALSLAAPAGVAIVVNELALGLVARTSPQVPVFFAGMPLRAALGIAAVLLALSLLVATLPDAFRTALAQASHLLSTLAPR